MRKIHIADLTAIDKLEGSENDYVLLMQASNDLTRTGKLKDFVIDTEGEATEKVRSLFKEGKKVVIIGFV